MRPTPPSPSQDETSPHQSNGRAHSDGSAANPPPTAIASTERSTNTNDATSESDEDGIASRSSLNHSPNDTLLALGERLNRQRQQADVAPIDNSNIAPSPSPFRHSIMNSNTTSLTSANLLNSALLERRRFSTPANPEDAGNRTPSTATTGLTTSDEGWERMRRSRGPTPSSVMGQQGSTETGEGDDGGRSNGHATDGDTSSVDNTAPATSPSPENLENPPLERRVYTDADLREIRTSASSITPTSSTEGWERVRLRYPPPPNYRNANLDGSSDTRDDSNAAPPPPTEGWEIVKRRPRIPPPPATTAATAVLSDEDSQPEHSEHKDSPEEDDGSALDPYPSGSGLGPERPWKTAGYSRRLMETADTQRAMVEFGAAEDRRRATRFARLARFSAATAAAAAGNATDGNASSNDTTASSASPNLIDPVERRVYTNAGLLGIGQRIPSAPITGAPTEGWARVRRPRAPGPALDYRNANLDGASDMPHPLPPPDIRVTTEPTDSNDAPSNAATSTSNHTNSALGSSSSTPANLNNTGLRTPGTSRTEQRERSNRSGSPAPSPPAAAQGSQASAEREGEPNTGPTQTGAENDSEEDAECSEDDSYDHVPYNGSSSAVAAAAANSGSLYQQRRREHDSTDDRYEYQDEGPLDPPPPYLSQEDVGDEVDEDFDVESKEVDYPESDT
jgi:hypothetical protein